MANTVIAVRSSSATGNQPSLGVIANGELSLNFADGILYYKTSSNTLGQIRTTQVSGSNQQVQFNDSGSFGSNSKFTFDKNTGTLSVTNVVISNVSTTGLLSSSYNPSSVQQVSVVSIAGSNTKGGTGYVDFLSANNQSSGATNTNKWFRLDNSGSFQIINSAYTTNIFNLSDVGNLTAPNLTLSAGGGGAITFADGTKQYTANAGSGGGSVTSVGGQTGAISNTQLVSFVTTPTLPTTGNIIVYNGTSFASLANTGTAGTYGNAAYHPVITTDAYGRVSAVTNTAISIPTTAVTGTFGFSSGGTNATSYTTGTVLVSNGTAIVSLANTGTAGTYGNAAYHPVITTDAYGRVSAVTNTAISIPTTAVTGTFGFSSGGTNATSYTTGTLLTSNGTAIISLANTGTAGTYGNATYVPVITTDAYGRVTSVVNTAISGGTNFNIYNVNSSIYRVTANGAQTSFDMGFSPVTSNNVIVTTNGIVQYDYSIVGSVITFNFTPANNTIVRAQVFGSNNAGVLAGSTPIVNNISFYNVNTQIYQATANGAQTSFNLGFTPTTSNNAVVTANGVVQYDYSITGSTLTFNFTPANNTLIRAQAFGVASPTNSATYNGDLTTIGNLTANTVTISNGILLNNTSIGLTQTVSTSYNGLSVGPMTLLSGVSVTVASGQRWYIL